MRVKYFALGLIILIFLLFGSGIVVTDSTLPPISVDRNNYQIDDTLNLSINIDPANYTFYYLMISALNNSYTYKGDFNSVMFFYPTEEGIYTIALVEKSTGAIFYSLSFNVSRRDVSGSFGQENGLPPPSQPTVENTSQNASIKIQTVPPKKEMLNQSSGALIGFNLISTDKKEYLEGEPVRVFLNISDWGNFRLYHSFGGDSKRYMGDLKIITFVPAGFGMHKLILTDNLDNVLGSYDFEIKPILRKWAIRVADSRGTDEKANISAYDHKGDFASLEIIPNKKLIHRIILRNVKLAENNVSLNLSIGVDDVSLGRINIKQKKILKAFALDPSRLNFTNGTATSTAVGTELWKCKEWDFENQLCLGAWQKIMNLVPGQDYEIELNSDDPGYAETNITIINVQSFPTVGDNWTVAFNTTGKATLTIRAVGGSTWTDYAESGYDLKFLKLRCGEESLEYSWINDSVVIADYSCNETSFELSEVLTSGMHNLEFSFGDDIEYAHNNASHSWWNRSWLYRKQLNITNNNATLIVENGYTVMLVLNTTGAKFRSAGNDTRIVYWNGTGNIELNRINITAFNSTTTQILFKLQANISGGSYDNNYYVYYGNPSAGAPPSNKSNVYDFWDDFSGNLSQWTVDSENTDAVLANFSQGNPAPSLRHNPDSTQSKGNYDTRLITTIYKFQNGIIEYDLYLSGTARSIHQLGFRVPNINFTNGYCWRLQSSTADGGWLEFAGRTSWTGFGTAYPAVTTGTWHHVILNISGANYNATVDGGSAYSGTDNTKLTLDYLVSHVHATGTDYYVLVDNIKVRKYIKPEPSITLGGEEESIPPAITNASLNKTAINQSEIVKLNVTVTDDNNITGVNATILYWNGTSINFSMSKNGGNIYYLNFSDTNHTGTYNVTNIIAVDVFGNINNTQYTNLSFTISATFPSPFNLLSPGNNSFSSNLLPNLSWENSSETQFSNYTIFLDKDSGFGSPDFTYYTLNITNTSYLVNNALDANAIYYWRVAAYDVFGNQRNSTNYFVYTTDTIDPAVNLNWPGNNNFVTVSNFYFNYTPSDTNLANCSLYGNFSGSWNNNQTNASPLNAQPNYFQISLQDGSYLWNVRCYDKVNRSSYASNNYTVNVDTHAPMVKLESPQNNTYENTTNNKVFYYNVSDNMTTVASCILVVDESQRGLPDYTIQEGVTQNFTAFIMNGQHNWSVNCTDSNGFIGASDRYNLSVNVLAETDPPVITPHYPAPDDYLAVSQITFNYTVDDASGIKNCSLYINSAWNQTNSSVINHNPNYFTVPGFANSLYSWYVDCYDNLSFAKGTFLARNFTVDLINPSISLGTPGNNNFYNSSSVLFNYTPTDTNLKNCSLYGNFTGSFLPDQANTTPQSGQPNYFTKNLGDGAYLWNVQCYDKSGRNGFATSNYTVKVDTVPPILSNALSSPASPATYAAAQVYRFNITVNETFLAGVWIEHNFSGVLSNYSVNSSSSNVYLYNYSSLGGGSYAFRWLANDSLGRISNTSQYAYFVDKAASEVNLSLNGTDGNFSITENKSVNITAKMVTPSSGYVELYMNGVLISNGSSPLTNITPFPDSGVYNITAVYPANQNYSESRETHFVMVNDTRAPNVSLMYPAQNATIGSLLVTFYYNVTDASNIFNCSIYINSFLNNTVANVTRNTTQPFTVAFIDGNYTWQVRCYDIAFNLGQSEIRNITIKETTSINITVNLTKTSYARGEIVPVNITVKDGFGNPLNANLSTSIIYTNTTVTSAPWLNSSWRYRKPMNLTVSSNSTPKNYSLKLILNSSNVESNWNWSNECVSSNSSRIRFANSSGYSELGFWVESCSASGQNMTVWVKIDNNITSSGYIIYLYYSGTGVDAKSNGSAAFDFFDDFNDNLDQWTIDPENTDAVSVSSSLGNPSPSLRHDPDSTQSKGNYDTRLRTTSYMFQNGIIEYDLYLSGTARSIHQFGFRVDSLSFGNGYAWRLQSSEADGGWFEFSGGSWAAFGPAYAAVSTGTWHHVILNISGANYNATVDGGSAYSGTDNTKLTADYLVSHVHATGTDYYALADNIRARKTTMQEPTATYNNKVQELMQFTINETPALTGFATVSFNSSNKSYGNYSVVSLASATGFNNGYNATFFYLGPDITGPVTVITNPSNMTNISTNIYSLNANASDISEVNIVTFMYRQNQTDSWHFICNDDRGPIYDCDWNLTNLPDGNTYEIRAYANDTFGNIGANDTRYNITVDRQGPITVLDMPHVEETIAVLLYTVNASASDAISSVDTVIFEYRENSSTSWKFICSDNRPPVYECDWNLTGLESGTSYEVRAYANDSLGNIGSADAHVNITLITEPVNITSILVDDNNYIPIDEVTLQAGTTKNVLCNITVRSPIDYTYIEGVNATFYSTTASYGAADNNRTHYSNASCSFLTGGGDSADYVCAFNIWHFAINGTWNCTAFAWGIYSPTNSTDNTTINQLFALNISTSVIDYSNLQPNQTSQNITVNISNAGNMPMNISVYGFGGDNESAGTGLSMLCRINNISISFERFSINTSSDYNSKRQLLASPQDIGLTIPAKNNASEIRINSTYWQFMVPPQSQTLGLCNGSVVFMAQSP